MEEVMSRDLVPLERPVSGRFHPWVFALVGAFALMFVLAAWTFTANLYLGVVTWVFVVSVGIPAALGYARRSSGIRRSRAGYSDSRFSEWAEHDVDTLTGPLKGRFAAAEALLPIAAVGLGMVAFAIVVHLAR
jgi:hypothetical protein